MKKTVLIYINSLPLSITGEFTPEEKMVRYYRDGSGHPGSPPEFEIESIDLLAEWNVASKLSNVLSLIEEIDDYYDNIPDGGIVTTFCDHLSFECAEKLQAERDADF